MKRIEITLALLMFSCILFAQGDYLTTIKTPTNVSIQAYYLVEFSANDLALVEAEAADWINDHNSNAVRVAPASRTYNCHNYAWHNSDGGSRRWINQKTIANDINLAKYWSGGSPTYQSTSSLRAAKVYYPNGDHSAKIISANLFESKWGNWPRYQHLPTDCPYNSSSLQYYYIPLEGDELICTSKTFLTLNIAGATYNWSGEKISITGSDYSTIATKISDGTGWIQTEISSPYSGTTVKSEKKTFWAGASSFILTGDEELTTYDWGAALMNFGTVGKEGQGITTYEWDYTGPITKFTEHDQLAQYQTGRQTGMGAIYATADNGCGLPTSHYLVYTVSEYWMLTLSPNPAVNEATLLLEPASEEKTLDDAVEWEVEVYSETQNLMEKKTKMRGNRCKIQTAGWMEGIYFVRVKIEDELLQAKLVVKR